MGKGFQYLGLTLILEFPSLFTFGCETMFSMFFLISTALTMTALALLNLARLVLPTPSPRRNPGVATSLLERASAIEGQNPHEASELRQSALAFLSVAR